MCMCVFVHVHVSVEIYKYSCVHKTLCGSIRGDVDRGMYKRELFPFFICIRNPSEASRVLTQPARRDTAQTLATSSNVYKQRHH